VGRSVYVSWNGATSVVRWALLTGTEKDRVVRSVRSVRKEGFETAISAVGVGEYFVVEALGADEGVLEGSAVYRKSDGNVAET
jgi:hypothetical protein